LTHHLAVDIGGTFTDFVITDGETGEVRIEKAPSRPDRLEHHFFEGIERLGVPVEEIESIQHGTTIALNTILQMRGCQAGLLTTEGFRDALEICRGARKEIYNLLYHNPEPLIARRLRREIPERLDHHGDVIRRLDEERARAQIRFLLDEGCEALAVVLLHAYRNPAHELRVGELIEELAPGIPYSLSHAVAAEWREYERTSTTVLNSYVAPKVAGYIDTLEAGLGERGYDGVLTIMQSTGGSTSADRGRQAPISTLESGPAGGVIAAAKIARDLDRRNAISADVGGTSFDVSLIVDGAPAITPQTELDRRPVLVPTIDIVSIGAGGGSIASVDVSGALHVGPESAQADPGPACFGRGGTRPTVTDAYAVLGIIDPANFLGRRMELDVDAAREAVEREVGAPLGLGALEAAGAIVRLTTMNMVLAIRNLTIERGHDPREFSLVAFGGGGGMFASYIANELDMPEFVVPPMPANFSAWGILNSDYRFDSVRHHLARWGDDAAAMARRLLDELSSQGRDAVREWGHLEGAVEVEWFLDVRYVGQEHTIRVPIEAESLAGETVRARFETMHEYRYSHAYEGQPLELVNVRAVVTGVRPRPQPTSVPSADGPDPAPARRQQRELSFAGEPPAPVPVYDRELLRAGMAISGPAIVEEWTSTIVIGPGDVVSVDAAGHLVVRCGGADHARS
jgi:N-methylhydantoinase A